jgi:hypothetical protein
VLIQFLIVSGRFWQNEPKLGLIDENGGGPGVRLFIEQLKVAFVSLGAPMIDPTGPFSCGAKSSEALFVQSA